MSLAGEFKFTGLFIEGTSKFRNEITAQLIKSGNDRVFDATQNRIATTAAEFNGGNFKSHVTVSPDNTIKTKAREITDVWNWERSNYSVAQFSGSSSADFAAHAAVVKDKLETRTFPAGMEYRDTRYAHAPESSLLSKLNEVDLMTDPFYWDRASVAPDFSGLSCSLEAAVVLKIDLIHPLIHAVQTACQTEQLQNMDFCRSDGSVFQAQEKCKPT